MPRSFSHKAAGQEGFIAHLNRAKLWRHAFQALLAIPAGIVTFMLSEKLQKLSGNALWLPPENRHFISVVGSTVGIAGVYLGIWFARRRKKPSKLALALGALTALTVASAVYLIYLRLADATTQDVRTTWGDKGEKDGLEIEFGGEFPPILQKLGRGNYRIRIPREWSPEDRQFWKVAASDLSGPSDRASMMRRGLTAKFSNAPVEAIDRILDSASARDDISRQNAMFLSMHILILVAVGVALALLAHRPVEALTDAVMERIGHFVSP